MSDQHTTTDYAIVDPNDAKDSYAGNGDVRGRFRRLTDALGCEALEG